MEPQEKKPRKFSRFVAIGGLLVAIFVICNLPFLLGGCGPTPPVPTSANTQEPSLTETLATEEPASTEAPITATLDVGSPQPEEHATLSLEEELARVQAELDKSLKGNFKYTAPASMKLNETLMIELLLNPSLSADELGTQIVESGGLVTSTADPGVLLTTDGAEVKVFGSEVEITPLMMAVLVSEDPQAFDIQRLHTDDIQPVGKNATTTWKWLITAREAGMQKLVLVIYKEVKIDNNGFWPPVETYRADINVNVPFVQRLLMLDWKWIAGVLATALLIPAFWRWYDQRKKQNDQAPKPKRQKKNIR
jgi:hypothetical protein